MAKRKAAPTPTTHFVVARLNWRRTGGVFVRLPGEARVAAVPDADAAAVRVHQLEAEARGKVNPFRCGAVWADRCSMPEPVFRDFLRDAGVDPPADADLAEWWDEHAAALSAEQVGRVWEGLDRVRFYRVEERPVRQVVYAVVMIQWQYNDMWYYPSAEGGDPVAAYRSRERAEAECARQNAEEREKWRQQLHLPPAGDLDPTQYDAQEVFQFDMEGRPFPGHDPLDPPVEPPPRDERWDGRHEQFTVDEVPFYEVVEFELAEGE